MKKLTIATVLVFLLTTASVMAADPASGQAKDPDEKYDRLDGHGASGMKIDVVEWEGNLEVHVYPGGSLKSLAAKLDDRDKDKKVMVLGLRFKGQPDHQLVRRAILGVPFSPGFLAFRDPSVTEYDKIVLSNNGLSGEYKKYDLEPGPGQLYPDGHLANEVAANPSRPDSARMPASQPQGMKGSRAPFVPPQRQDAGGLSWKAESLPQAPARVGVDENGAIRPFDFR